MDIIDPTIYNKINKPHIEAARGLMALILADHPQRHFDVILDVGCGSGNVTKILSDSIPHKNILAFDINAKMIRYADMNNTNRTTEFIVQDVAKPWDKLDGKLKALEGNVDLIVSNYVFQLIAIRDRHVAFDNIFRLLKPDGLMYSIIPIVEPIYNFLYSEETKTGIEKHLKIDSSERQISKWIHSFELNGFTNVETKFSKYEWNFRTTEEFRKMLPLFRKFYLNQIPQFAQLDYQSRTDLVSKVDKAILEAFSIKSEILPNRNSKSYKYSLPHYGLVIKAKVIKTTDDVFNETSFI